MGITREADYAIRIVYFLSDKRAKYDAKSISDSMVIGHRFALKILMKLVNAGILISFKGAKGGYSLAKEPSEISMLEVMEAVDGKQYLNKCICTEIDCNRMENKNECVIHKKFAQINDLMCKEFSNATFQDLLNEN